VAFTEEEGRELEGDEEATYVEERTSGVEPSIEDAAVDNVIGEGAVAWRVGEADK
jgi:hypothetical protein